MDKNKDMESRISKSQSVEVRAFSRSSLNQNMSRLHKTAHNGASIPKMGS